MVKVAPSLLSADFTRLGEEIRRVEEAGADLFHIDVMDGRFVPNITVGPFIVEAIGECARIPLDVHLMIVEPDRYIKDFRDAGGDKLEYISVHVEACVHLHRTVSAIRDTGAKPALALNPATPLEVLDDILPDVEMVLLMSVNPGFGGQRLIRSSLGKIRRLRDLITKRDLPALIEVDGGIKPENAGDLREAGADILVSGSGIFGSEDYAKAIRMMRGE